MSIWGIVLRGGPASGAWMVGAFASYSNLQFAFIVATTLFLVIWLWTVPKTTEMAENLERSAEQRDSYLS
jgi:hypothetical protein